MAVLCCRTVVDGIYFFTIFLISWLSLSMKPEQQSKSCERVAGSTTTSGNFPHSQLEHTNDEREFIIMSNNQIGIAESKWKGSERERNFPSKNSIFVVVDCLNRAIIEKVGCFAFFFFIWHWHIVVGCFRPINFTSLSTWSKPRGCCLPHSQQRHFNFHPRNFSFLIHDLHKLRNLFLLWVRACSTARIKIQCPWMSNLSMYISVS